jgi:hypothetical protein
VVAVGAAQTLAQLTGLPFGVDAGLIAFVRNLPVLLRIDLVARASGLE